MFACNCSIFRQPMMGNTYGVFCITYAIATAWMLFAPTCCATSSRALQSFRSFSVRSQSGRLIVRPARGTYISGGREGQRDRGRTVLARLPPPFLLLVGADVAGCEYTVGRERETFVATHGEDVALGIAHKNRPLRLVDNERRLAVEASVLVGLNDKPGRHIRDALKKKRGTVNSCLRNARRSVRHTR